MKKLIGLTGGIASGKSVAMDYIEQQGYAGIRADILGHQVLEPEGDAYIPVLEAFGEQILDEHERISRTILGSLVFSDPQKLQRLNRITHPLIQQKVIDLVPKLQAQSKHGFVFLEAAILIEAQWHLQCEQTWLITTPPEVALQRIQQRSGLTPEQAQQRLNVQLSNEERVPYADVVIENVCDLQELFRTLQHHLNRLA